MTVGEGRRRATTVLFFLEGATLTIGRDLLFDEVAAPAAGQTLRQLGRLERRNVVNSYHEVQRQLFATTVY